MVDVGRWSWQETGRGIGAVEGVVEPREAMPQAAALGWVIGSAGQTPGTVVRGIFVAAESWEERR